MAGYICETDTFGSNRKISEISEGDYLVFKNAGLTALQCQAITTLDLDRRILYKEGKGF